MADIVVRRSELSPQIAWVLRIIVVNVSKIKRRGPIVDAVTIGVTGLEIQIVRDPFGQLGLQGIVGPLSAVIDPDDLAQVWRNEVVSGDVVDAVDVSNLVGES